MKKRVQVDVSLLVGAILFSGIFLRFPQWYTKSYFFDSLLLVLGTMTILSGVFLRMAARGHKKAHSKEGHGLVTTGLYAYVRNPMYLGSFLIGAGFVVVAWPWWLLPVFTAVFFWRFNQQVKKEEQHLTKTFGKTFAAYARRVPRFIPLWKQLKTIDLARVCPWPELWSTHEKRALLWWPLVVIAIESLQERVVFAMTEIRFILCLVAVACLAFFLIIKDCYQQEEQGHAKNPARAPRRR